ncbi:MAG TPA: glycosyltransferase family 9 protein [Nevskiales bacterium]|nr:glycosyltransferase family 9 protein [Nevskiales bacterium]
MNVSNQLSRSREALINSSRHSCEGRNPATFKALDPGLRQGDGINQSFPSSPIKKVVIWAPRKLGNALMTLPAIQLLRANCPDAEVSVVCHPILQSLFRSQSWVSEVIEDSSKSKGLMTGNLSLLRELRRRRFNLGIVFHKAVRCALLFRLAGVMQVIGFAGSGHRFLLDYSQRSDDGTHRVNRHAMLVNEYFGRPARFLPAPHLDHAPLPTPLFVNSKLTLGLHLGTPSKGCRSYPTAQACALISRLVSRRNVNIVLLGDQAEQKESPEYARAAAGYDDFLDLRGKTDLPSLVSTVATLDLLVAIDSSVMHIAAAVGTEFIVLLGRSHVPFELVRPKVPFGIYLDRGDMLIQECEKITSISVDDVLNAIDDVLAKAKKKNSSRYEDQSLGKL